MSMLTSVWSAVNSCGVHRLPRCQPGQTSIPARRARPGGGMTGPDRTGQAGEGRWVPVVSQLTTITTVRQRRRSTSASLLYCSRSQALPLRATDSHETDTSVGKQPSSSLRVASQFSLHATLKYIRRLCHVTSSVYKLPFFRLWQLTTTMNNSKALSSEWAATTTQRNSANDGNTTEIRRCECLDIKRQQYT